MSKNKHDSYVKYSEYSGGETKKSAGPYKVYAEIQAQSELPQRPNQNPSQGPSQNSSQGSSQNPSQGPTQNPSQPQEKSKSRVREIEGSKLFNLLTDVKFKSTKTGRPSKVVIKVYTDWCGPCKKIEPYFEELTFNPKYSDILFVKVNGERLGKDLQTLLKDVGAVPVFFGYVAGEKAGFVAGTNIQEIVNMCDEICKY